MPRYEDYGNYGIERPRKVPKLRPRRESSRTRWQRGLWSLFSACVLGSFILLGLAVSRAQFSLIATIYGGCLVVVSIILAFVVTSYEDRVNPPSQAEGAGIAAIGFLGGLVGIILFFMLRHTGRWPQPLLTLLLAIGTIAAAVALDRPDQPAVAQQQPQQPVIDLTKVQPKADPPKSEPPKQEPKKTEPPKPVEPVKPDPANTARPFLVDPMAKSAGPTLYLTNLTPFAFQNSPWKLGMGVKGEDGKSPLLAKGEEYKYGICMHPPKAQVSCMVSFVPGSEFKRFKGSAGIGDGMNPFGTVVFAVYGGGRKLWESTGLNKAATSVPFDIDITGVDVLTLETRMKDGHNHAAYAIWFNPWLER